MVVNLRICLAYLMIINIYMSADIYKNSCGRIEQFFTPDQLNNFVEIFKKIDANDGSSNDCYGINQQHLAYAWLRAKILTPISEEFNTDTRLIFAMLLDCVNPFDIHHDLKTLPEANGKHFLSFLIPYSVDDDCKKCNLASTLVFNETYSDSDNFLSITVENNVSAIHQEKISHVPIEQTHAFSLKQELIWSSGDLLWWDSRLWHVSNNFLSKGCRSKQGIVIHTYVL